MKTIYMECTLNLMLANGSTPEEINKLALSGTVKSIESGNYIVVEE